MDQWEDNDQLQFALAEALGKPCMCELLGQNLAAPDPLPEAYLKNAGNLTRLPFCSVVSFNWDVLLPPMYAPAAWRGADFSSICAGPVGDRAPLFEVRGSVNDCVNIIVSEADYAAVSEDRTAFFERLLSEATVLYVGMNVHSGHRPVAKEALRHWQRRHGGRAGGARRQWPHNHQLRLPRAHLLDGHDGRAQRACISRRRCHRSSWRPFLSVLCAIGRHPFCWAVVGSFSQFCSTVRRRE